jgi:hypothetical protein
MARWLDPCEAKRRERYRQRVAAGLCVREGCEERVSGGRVLCESHRAKQRESSRRHRISMTLRGLCQRCGNDVDRSREGAVYCRSCCNDMVADNHAREARRCRERSATT